MPDPKYKISQQVLNDFSATVDAKPDLSTQELLDKFPEFNKDTAALQSAMDYYATSKSGKYKSLEELNSKFPEFGLTQQASPDETKSYPDARWNPPAAPVQQPAIPPSIKQSSFWNPKPPPAPALKGGNAALKPVTYTADAPDVKKAIDNAVVAKNKTYGVTGNKVDKNFGRKEIEQQVKEGKLVASTNNQGEPVLKRGDGNFFSAFKDAFDNEQLRASENQYIASAPKGDVIAHLNMLRTNPGASPFDQESDKAATGFWGKAGETIGGNTSFIGKNTIGHLLGTLTAPETLGASEAAAFTATANDLANSGYSQALKKNYNLLKEQHPDMSDEDAYDKAHQAALAAEATSLATGAALSGNITGGLPKPTVATEGVFNGLKHAVQSSPKVIGTAVGGSVANDLISNAIGAKISGNEMTNNAAEAAKGMAVMHFGIPIAMGLPEAVASIPSYLRPQFENAVASAPREQVLATAKQAEDNGEVPPGSTDKLATKLDNFDIAKESIPSAVPLSEETKAAIAGKTLQKAKLKQQIDELSQHGDAYKSHIEVLNKQVSDIDATINNMAQSNDPFLHETDNLTGERLHPVKTYEDLSGKEKAGIVVPKEYGETEMIVQDNGDGEKTFTPVAFTKEKKGGLEIKNSLEVGDQTFTDKAKAQDAADKALAQHYYENGMSDNLKPIDEKLKGHASEAPKTKGEPENITKPIALSTEITKHENNTEPASDQAGIEGAAQSASAGIESTVGGTQPVSPEEKGGTDAVVDQQSEPTKEEPINGTGNPITTGGVESVAPAKESAPEEQGDPPNVPGSIEPAGPGDAKNGTPVLDHAQHANNIKEKFRQVFKAKGNSEEHIDAAIALMDARAKSWAGEEKGRTPEQWYQRIADVKNGEFEPGTAIQHQVEAWHGSPHDFDRFSLDKIGTGEGAQAFGHGLYFTDLKEIARQYASKLAGARLFFEGKEVTSLHNTKLSDSQRKALLAFREYDYNSQDARRAILEDKYGLYGDLDKRNKIVAELGKIEARPKDRLLYKVLLHKNKSPADYNWMVWDKPLTEKQKSLLQKAGIRLAPNDTGESVYKRIAAEIGDKYASNLLLRKGIDGIKYPAESISRGITSDNARGFNYVMFDDKAVSIKEKVKFQGEKGAMETLADGRMVIHALQAPDVSTMVHEIAHVFEKDLTEAEKKVFGDDSEVFARGFERYLRDGQAPTQALQTLFGKFKQWLTNIYQSLKGSPIEQKVSPELKGIFERLLTDKAVTAGEVKPLDDKGISDLHIQLGDKAATQLIDDTIKQVQDESTNPTEPTENKRPASAATAASEATTGTESTGTPASPTTAQSEQGSSQTAPTPDSREAPAAEPAAGEPARKVSVSPATQELLRENKAGKTKASQYLRAKAAQVRDKGILPDFMKADLPEGTQGAGVTAKGLSEAFAQSLELLADAIDAGKEAADAAQEALSHLKAYYQAHGATLDEAKAKAHFEGEAATLAGEAPPPPADQHSSHTAVGVSHDHLNDLAKRLGLPEIPRGTRLSPEEYADRGRKLLEAGADIEKLAADFKGGKQPTADDIAVARAHLEDLTKEADAVGKDQGFNSKEYKAAVQKADEWARTVVKPMGTVASEPFTALQGSRDLDTGSFTTVKQQVETITGKPVTKEQEAKIEALTAQNEALKKQAADLEKQLVEATDKHVHEPNPKAKDSHKYEKAFQKAADTFRKLKTKPFTFKDENGNEIHFQTQGFTWNDLVEAGAKAMEATGKIADGVAAIIDKVKDTDWYKNLSDKDKTAFEKQLTDHYEGAIQDTPEAKLLKRLQKQLDEVRQGIVKQKGIAIEDTPEIKDLREQLFEAKKNLGLIKSKALPESKLPVSEEQKRVNRLEKQLADLEQGIVKEKAKPFEDTPAIKALKDKIFEAKKNLGLLPSTVKEVGEPDYGLKITAEEKKIERLEKEKADLEKGIIKQKEVSNLKPTPEQQAKIDQLNNDIHDLKQNLGLLKSKMPKPEDTLSPEEKAQQQNINRLTKAIEEAKANRLKAKPESRERSDEEKDLQAQLDAALLKNNLADLQQQFANKSDTHFTPEEAKALWDYAKKAYLNKGIPYRDMLAQVSNDTGLSWRQVKEALVSPKVKPISDAMWKKQADLRKSQNATKHWIEQQNKSTAYKALMKASGAVRGLQVFGHGGIFIGTHAGMTTMNPSTWHIVIPAFFRAWKFAYGNTAAYEQAMEELKHRPNYVLAERAGLKVNPDKVNVEEYQKDQKVFGKLGDAGVKGFNAIKVLRQDLFDYHFNKLSAVDKADPEVHQSIARLINNATGATNLNIPEWVNEVTFAGGMEASRWGKLTRNPAEATQTALRALVNPDKVSAADKVFAKVWARRVGEQLGTFAGLLAVNAAIQNYFHPANKTNLTHPDKPDFLKFKFGTTTIDPTSGMLGTFNFIKGLAEVPFKTQKELGGDTRMQAFGKATAGYVRGKSAPLYGTAIDFATQTDFNGNPMPFSNDKPRVGKHKLDWLEYIWQKAPLPLAEAAKVTYQAAEDAGANKIQLNQVGWGILSGAISGSTGFRVGEYQEKADQFTDADKKDKTFKYFLDKGLDLPDTSLSAESVTDNKAGTVKTLADYPKEVQDQYQQTHKEELKKVLQGRLINGVYVTTLKDKDGKDLQSVELKAPANMKFTKKVAVSQLDTDELTQLLSHAQSEATTRTKKKIFKTK